MATPAVRTIKVKNNDIIPPVISSTAIKPQNFYRGKQIKFICPTCASEYCPNFLQYARLDEPINASFMNLKQPCDICGAYSKFIGVTDPANYGGIGKNVA